MWRANVLGGPILGFLLGPYLGFNQPITDSKRRGEHGRDGSDSKEKIRENGCTCRSSSSKLFLTPCVFPTWTIPGHLGLRPARKTLCSVAWQV